MPPTLVSAVSIGRLGLAGELALPEQALGVALFAHGSGSSRLSPRNRYVAQVLNSYHVATVLFDLFTEAEGRAGHDAFDIALLGQRLKQALAWQQEEAGLSELPAGVFGASTGAAAAMLAAADPLCRVLAVVSRGGRPDLAAEALPRVRAPTLLIVGARDTEVLQLNRQALRALTCTARLEVVPDATHLFPEPGALQTVAHMAGNWFAQHLPAAGL